MASEIVDVPAPFTTKLTQEQMSEYRKRKVALISGACSRFLPIASSRDRV